MISDVNKPLTTLENMITYNYLLFVPLSKDQFRSYSVDYLSLVLHFNG